MRLIYGGTKKQNLELVKLISKDYFWLSPHVVWDTFFQYHEIDYQYQVAFFKDMEDELKRFVDDLPLGIWMKKDLLEDLQKYDSQSKPLMGNEIPSSDFETTNWNLALSVFHQRIAYRNLLEYLNGSEEQLPLFWYRKFIQHGKYKIPCKHFYIPISFNEYRKNKRDLSMIYHLRNCVLSTNEKITFDNKLLDHVSTVYFAKGLDYLTVKFYINNLLMAKFGCKNHFGSYHDVKLINMKDFYQMYRKNTNENSYLKIEYKKSEQTEKGLRMRILYPEYTIVDLS